ncbi:hypothetical protein F1188_02665 [Roseospira marina]|uniref:Uncharacterized protein n=1 Tax=Roseospira marina TaxID=140057 RepID=A0A5M6IEY3_9PROT|nr:hypothetical protein [Roseospira marina]KAA5606840.1 hypothetical protein F1188_02665 [Roseospira marina]MBB4312998.1 membrane protein implicated in regulation of membrane protease activity [Roseospira marina]MBB5086229.1 membrane protein implicated in regulation of membrane protease activity [Roseospira marina]
MPSKTLDTLTGATVASAPGWAPPLAVVNQWLTFASLLVGLAFLCWRWWRAWLRERRVRRDVPR